MEYKGYHYTVVIDNIPFRGGHYCQVFADEKMEKFVDDFFLHPFGSNSSLALEARIHQIIDTYGPVKIEGEDDEEDDG